MKESRKSTAVIVPSQMEIIDTLPEDIQLKVYKALFNYELFGTDFDEELLRNPVIQALWIMSKPLINKRIQWAENGRNGGLAKGKNSKSKANQKQTDSKPIANQKQTDSKSKADMDMEKDMDMEMEYPYLSGDIKNISPDRTDKERENKRESESIVEKEDEDDDWDWDWDKIPDPKQIGSGEVNV